MSKNKASVLTSAPKETAAPEPVETVEEVVEETPVAPAPAPAAKAVAPQPDEWMCTIVLNNDYTVAASKANKNMDSTIVLFDNVGGSINLGTMSISPQATESDVNRVVKKLASSIIGNLGRSPNLL
jgi:hypothetical protein